jgi:hypothetical protein
MKPLVQVELKKNPTCRSMLTSFGQMDGRTDGRTDQLLYARGHKNYVRVCIPYNIAPTC